MQKEAKAFLFFVCVEPDAISFRPQMSCKTCQIRTSAEFRARSAAHIGRAQASMATASSFMHIGDRISLFHEQTNGYLGAEGFSNMQVTNQPADGPPGRGYPPIGRGLPWLEAALNLLSRWRGVLEGEVAEASGRLLST